MGERGIPNDADGDRSNDWADECAKSADCGDLGMSGSLLRSSRAGVSGVGVVGGWVGNGLGEGCVVRREL